MKILQSRLYWPTIFKDSYSYCKTCNCCQMLESLTKSNQMPLAPIITIKIFDCWGIDFMGPFPPSFQYEYILLVVEYVSKKVEAIPTKRNDHRIIIVFLKDYILLQFGTPKAIISNQGTHFCNKLFETQTKRYGVTHKVSTAFHPQTNGQVELANRQIKHILEKTVNSNRKDWSSKLTNVLWAYRTAFKLI